MADSPVQHPTGSCLRRPGGSNLYAKISWLKQTSLHFIIWGGGGEFHVYRFNSFSGCPPRPDYDASLSPAYESDADLNPDVDTGDDFETSDEESEEGADEDDDLTSSVRFLSIGDGLPSFGVILAAAHFNGTLEMPLDFWKRYLYPRCFPCKAYFTLYGATWEMQIAKTHGKIRVKRGWSLFRRRNSLVWGMTLHFLLSDVNGIHFYVLIKP
ncbi:uncharacterized protein LOC125220410 [Salvia hispanica]|uniref:uncharacterized protein LOC125220410 n=1 Tax=Salvia hispanica TaxID=49212 RepID=UPI00200954EE|nr:uncharacterized protein LOC125220410 [Salvia hispanica]